MATSYSRRAADGSIEYHDDRDSLIESQRREDRHGREAVFGLFGLILGALVTFVVLLATGIDFPKWLRLILVIAGGWGCAYVMMKFAEQLWLIIKIAVCAVILYGIWKLM